MGLGEDLILPGAGGVIKGLTGWYPSIKGGVPEGFGEWWGTNPMQGASQAQDWGRQGLFVSRGPQSTQWQPGQSWNQINTPAGVNTALFGSSYDPNFRGQGAYERFGDVQDSYNRRFATDLRDEQGNVIGFSPERGAGARTMQTFGGRNGFNQPLTGSDYQTHKEFAGLAALQQGANPYLNNPIQAALMAQQQEQQSPFARADPASWLSAVQGGETGPRTQDIAGGYIGQAFDQGQVSVEDMARMASGLYGSTTGDVGDIAAARYGGTVGGVQGMTNAYEQSLLDQMAQEGSKDLSLGIEDARNQLSAMGLGRSGQGQSTAAGVWSDIQQRNALQREQLMAQFRQAAMEREAGAMTTMGQAALGAEASAAQAMGQAGLDANARAILAQQGGGLNAILAAQQAAAQANEARLQRAGAGVMGGLEAQNASLEGSRAAQRGALLGGQEGTRQWNLGVQGNYLNSLQGADQAALARMVAESQEQSRGLGDYMNLQQLKDQMYGQRLDQMLGLEDRYRTSQNEVLNQMMQFYLQPRQDIMSMLTGLPAGGGSQARTNPWGPMFAQAGLQLGGNLLSGMAAPSAANLNIFGPNQR